MLIAAVDAGTYRVKSGIYRLISAIYLVNVVDLAYAVGRHGGYEHGYTGAYVGRQHSVGSQGKTVVETYHNGAVRVAEHDLRAHVDKPVYKKQT